MINSIFQPWENFNVNYHLNLNFLFHYSKFIHPILIMTLIENE
jgi:hypothetical protein